MTGYGSGEAGAFRVEMRSLNHRYMEVFLRMPQNLMASEIPLREALKKHVARGKVDVTLSVTNAESRLRLNSDRAAEVYRALKSLSGDLGMGGDVNLETLLIWRDQFMEQDTGYDHAALLEAFNAAAAALREMRRVEGEKLKRELLTLTASIESLNERIAARMPEVKERLREEYRARFKDLLGEGNIDEGRIVQEASSLVERGDIAEEIARVRCHVAQMREILETDGAIGRKLDFLMQEFNREANTMGSKADDAEVVAMVVEMKAEIERAREQVQNIQ